MIFHTIEMDRKIIVCTHYMPGNTGIQLAVAHILAKTFNYAHIETYSSGDIQKKSRLEQTYSDKGIVNIIEDTWPNIYPFIGQGIPPCIRNIMEYDLYIAGFFQYSEPLVKYRDSILEWFKTCDIQVSSNGTTMREFMSAPAPIPVGQDDVVLHVRLGDYIDEAGSIVIDPAPQIALLRKELGDRKLIIVCAKPKRDMENNYLKFFEEFHPTLQHGTELEDFAVLRSANRIIVTNSSFSWLAAFIGSAEKRWIPVKTNTEDNILDNVYLGKISDSDIIYEAEYKFPIYDIATPKPSELFLPVTGEFLQSMCEYTFIDREYKEGFGTAIEYAHPIERQIFTDVPTPDYILQAKSIFIYPSKSGENERHVFQYTWPNLRFILLHNSDFGVHYDLIIPFLEANPNVWVWAQNATEWHPRIRSIPIFEQNRKWRWGHATNDPPKTISRNLERDIEILLPFWSLTHPIRRVWRERATEIHSKRPDMQFISGLSTEYYLEYVEQSRAMICPPGNGVDTHRHWEALAQGAWAIVEDNAHTRLLMRTYPSLHLLPIRDMDDIVSLKVPSEIPEFHPMLLRPFWKTMFKSQLL